MLNTEDHLCEFIYATFLLHILENLRAKCHEKLDMIEKIPKQKPTYFYI
jgi:hypothetical protein